MKTILITVACLFGIATILLIPKISSTYCPAGPGATVRSDVRLLLMPLQMYHLDYLGGKLPNGSPAFPENLQDLVGPYISQKEFDEYTSRTSIHYYRPKIADPDLSSVILYAEISKYQIYGFLSGSTDMKIKAAEQGAAANP